MKIILFGATGMIGQGVLRECLLDTTVEQVLAVGRTPLETKNPKIKELIHKDLANYDAVEKDLAGYDACFFCLGTPSAGKTEAEYTRVTYGFAYAAAKTLVKLNPQMTFIYVSGDGADSTEKGRVMWARVRGKLENDLLKLPFKNVTIFRPGIVIPFNGIESKTTLYRVTYKILGPLLKLIRLGMPGLISTTEVIGRAMLAVAKKGSPKPILFSHDFTEV